MTRALGLRQYRACVRCRSRKTRCDLQSTGDPGRLPCAKCHREGAECVLADSRRGGDYSCFRRQKKALTSPVPYRTSTVTRTDTVLSPTEAVHDSLQNPSDALLILAHAAGQKKAPGTGATEGHDVLGSIRPHRAPLITAGQLKSTRGSNSHDPDNILLEYPLFVDNTVTPGLVAELLVLYASTHHQFLPIVPSSLLDPDRVLYSAREEPFLLTTILVISSWHRPDLAATSAVIWDHMQRRILDVVLGRASTRTVGCVEGLLLLGEWMVHGQASAEDVNEDAAWSISGLAVRLAYLLRLEESSFKCTENENDPLAQRKRLVWTFTYLLDRQISIRMGQAFWCRGPSLSVRFTAQDFPSLQPCSPADEDMASWVQAQVELTTLFGNVHDILYASRSRTAELMVRGDYTKYVDDMHQALLAWQSVWHSISVSPHLRSCLTLMQEYLRLYVSAFAFQAVLYRASRQRATSASDGQHRQLNALCFPDTAMASPDARHIYEAVAAAESLLSIVTSDFDPQKHLRYMPARFYLYEIHSSVFLFKAHAAGVISTDKISGVTELMRRFIAALAAAAVDESHIASRYARLLHRLWFPRPDPADEAPTGRDPGPAELSAVSLGGWPAPVDEPVPPLDGVEIDDLFAMLPVFPWDSLFEEDLGPNIDHGRYEA